MSRLTCCARTDASRGSLDRDEVLPAHAQPHAVEFSRNRVAGWLGLNAGNPLHYIQIA